jgi:hypothetical protein
LKPGGEMLIVFDDTILNGSTCLGIRQWLLDNFIILGIHSLPFNAFFKAKANIKTSILHARKKVDSSEEQGYVFMSISNNIGHDNSLKDTPEKNNLPDIFSSYVEWKRTGIMQTFSKENHDLNENLECPEQAWIVAPEQLEIKRLDAFYYSPDLKQVKEHLHSLKADGLIELHTGKEFKLVPKLNRSNKIDLVQSGQIFKYIEISDVTDYGLIMKHVKGTFDQLPTRGEYQVKKGDILIALNISSRGTVVIVPEEFDGTICTSGFLVIRPKDEEHGFLLWYSLRSEYCRKQIYYLSQTASQPELKREVWNKEFLIPMPLNHQEAIDKARAFQLSLRSLLNANEFRFS